MSVRTSRAHTNEARDKDFSNALHGKVAGNRGGFAAILSKDREAQKAHSKEYFDLWEGKNDEGKPSRTCLG